MLEAAATGAAPPAAAAAAAAATAAAAAAAATQAGKLPAPATPDPALIASEEELRHLHYNQRSLR